MVPGVGPRAARRRLLIAEYEARHLGYRFKSRMDDPFGILGMSGVDWRKYMKWRSGFATSVMDIGLTRKVTR